jgi:carboxylesterase type B
MNFRTIIFVVLFYQLRFAASSSINGSPTATLDSGVIVGTTTLLPSSTFPVHKFLGIPFASPPERFAAPVAPAPWGGLLNTTEAKPACIQAFICKSLSVVNS